MPTATQIETVQNAALRCLLSIEPDEKCALSAQLAASVCADAFAFAHPATPIALSASTAGADLFTLPGRPALPKLVAPRELTQRKLSTEEGRAALLHAVAHIEFNAINLAWDAVYRFPAMPKLYYQEWASVAAEEAQHFQMLAHRLTQLGYRYGDFPAHNGLWEMAIKTEQDVLIRMALVPRLLEARGLDVTPGIIQKLEQVGDIDSVRILQRILHEEVRHVEIGSRWFAQLCASRQLDVTETFLQLLVEHAHGMTRGPFNRSARRAAGFSDAELDAMERAQSHQRLTTRASQAG